MFIYVQCKDFSDPSQEVCVSQRINRFSAWISHQNLILSHTNKQISCCSSIPESPHVHTYIYVSNITKSNAYPAYPSISFNILIYNIMTPEGTMNDCYKGCVGFNILVIFKCLTGTIVSTLLRSQGPHWLLSGVLLSVCWCILYKLSFSL